MENFNQKLEYLKEYFNTVFIDYKLTPRCDNKRIIPYDEKHYPYPDIRSFEDFLRTKK